MYALEHSPLHHSVLPPFYSCPRRLSCTPNLHSASPRPTDNHTATQSAPEITNPNLNRRQAEHDLGFPINICVQHTQNVLELLWRHQCLHKSEALPSMYLFPGLLATLQGYDPLGSSQHTHGLTIFF